MSCRKVDRERCKKIIDSLFKKRGFMVAKTDGCSGYKSHTDGCPLNGIFDKDSPICYGCYVDAMNAMTEDMRDCEQL